MRIIICDDDPVFLDEMSGRIQAYFEKQGSNVAIMTVLDGNELLRMLGNYPADAVFLDIDMPGINGFETAGAVKKQYPDCILVFCSCHNELVYDSFEYEPFWFLCKSNAEEKTGMVLDKIVLKLIAGQREYAVRTKDRIIRVRYSDLLYAEVEKHKVRSQGCTSCTSVQQEIISCSNRIKMVQKPRKIKVFRGFLIPIGSDMV